MAISEEDMCFRVVGWRFAYPTYVFKYYERLLENCAEVEVCWA